jgi:acyl carrier protein
VDWDGVWAHERPRRRALPTYPFQRRRHWVDLPATSSAAVPAGAGPSAGAGAGAEQAPMAPQPVVAAGIGAGVGCGDAPEASSPALEAIRRIWVELLGIPDVGPHDNFFELGGHSLLGTKIVARIRDALGAELPAGALFEYPTIADLAEAAERAATPSAGPPNAGTNGAGSPGDDLEITPDLLAEILALSPLELHEQIADERRRAETTDDH